ncbi:glutathione S-transferase [Brenneria goodwinii]|uniref:Glutathione S-transferase n=1 Tax=Brenneria goodwinii TaxID=1109412 RepID=A0AAE8ELN8_9GAMM|nr:glutathione S-transferase N-terminal domain-containing protein [Brenneria goodwinii]ATA23864.1 glutathione S-transferase [Brenneria goodwinii]RLM19609.1 glutathione S-transferase [Brenneria goodwinii]
MIDLYSWNTPNGRKVSILLEELALPYRVHAVDIGKGEQHSEAFRAISPNGKIPAIVDSDSGLALMESGAILIYLADKTGRFLASQGDDRYRTLQWLMWQMGGFGPMLGQAHHFLHYFPGKSAYAEQRYHDEAQRLYGVLNRHLAGRQIVAEDYSIADIALWPWVARFHYQRINLNDYPHVRDWYLRLAGRPAIQRGYQVPDFSGDIPLPDIDG